MAEVTPISRTITAASFRRGEGPPFAVLAVAVLVCVIAGGRLASAQEPPALTQTVTGYPGTTDSFPVMSGVAPGGKWYFGKVFRDDLTNDGSELLIALDELMDQREALGVKVANLSLGAANSPVLSALATTVAQSGIVVVASAGNGGPSSPVRDPGLAGRVLTVGAFVDPSQFLNGEVVRPVEAAGSRGVEGGKIERHRPGLAVQLVPHAGQQLDRSGVVVRCPHGPGDAGVDVAARELVIGRSQPARRLVDDGVDYRSPRRGRCS